ncbi:hypothetical protein BMH32_00380 [Leucobacter sp. OLJS4]|uniref:glycoside hydrolase family 3 protein n=1 Tax=unclassified Leucobacter TaxID=2621730 RepID=UPI000C17F42F|nr:MULTISPECIES: glycoside hydrolase family 3 N-terminal domain-containing protein [unclassified Leucobacter]PII83755.1 hypothetical protein BMH25_06505 [Leucobacter sp. OLCALW19]PII89288.1 hypothetical protein BMH26_03545 [Leucobacter sp. OLTLW20]PII90715.1 hypothetical protein BMH27_10215 [Leucobacter sp. OLAS13]PII99570.1 hypothetical protein BMH29_03260 [Leucobacter sp. OLDS2]PIJ01773.1 hypothetical protein BMH28_05885 [Leucobacter sp. OLCS4]
MSARSTALQPAEGLRAEVRATLMPGFPGLEAPEWIRDALRDGLHSVCIYGENVRDADQLRALGRSLREARPDALVAIDEEGGEVTRLHYVDGAPYPGAAVLGRIDDLDYTAEIGARVARAVRSAGASLVLAPDSDVNANPRNPVIGTRSFSSDPERAAAHVAAWVRGAQAAGVATCPKHFPGHGDTAQDSHLALPVVDVAPEVLEQRELVPFRSAIAAGARTIMSSHILLPRVDPDAPATFSRTILQGILRKRLGFDGVVVSDALDMRGASGEIGIPAAAARALAAGCDLLCIGPGTTPAQLTEIEDRILAAVEAGELSAARVRDAAARVRALAEAVPPIDGDALTDLAAESAASDAVTADELLRVADSFSGTDRAHGWLRAHPGAAVVRVETVANMAVGFAPWGPFAAASVPLDGTGPAAEAFRARPEVPVDAETPGIWTDAPAVIVIGRELHRHSFAAAGIAALRERGAAVLTVEMGWPDAESPADLSTYGSSRLVGAALLSVLEAPAA